MEVNRCVGCGVKSVCQMILSDSIVVALHRICVLWKGERKLASFLNVDLLGTACEKIERRGGTQKLPLSGDRRFPNPCSGRTIIVDHLALAELRLRA